MIVTQNIDGLRSLSQIFTTSNFSKIVRNGDYKNTVARLKKHLTVNKGKTYNDIFKEIYKQLQKNYRSEYFYKNALLNKIVLGQYSINTTTILNEFKIGRSCADFVFLNGEIRVYEIKTELDDLSKLQKQIEDYSKFSNKVYVVSNSKHADALLEDLKETNIGIIEYTKFNTLKEIKGASKIDKLDHTTIFKTLRKQEYLDIINSELSITPIVPNTRVFKECLNIVKHIEIERFQQLALEQLKKRKLQCPDSLTASKTPEEFRFLCHSMNLNHDEYDSFYSFLNKEF